MSALDVDAQFDTVKNSIGFAIFHWFSVFSAGVPGRPGFCKSMWKPSSQSPQIRSREKFTACKFFRYSKLICSMSAHTAPRKALHRCASEAGCETESMVQPLEDELNRILNKMHSRAVLLQGMKHVLHKAGAKDCSVLEGDATWVSCFWLPSGPSCTLCWNCFMPLNAYSRL